MVSRICLQIKNNFLKIWTQYMVVLGTGIEVRVEIVIITINVTITMVI